MIRRLTLNLPTVFFSKMFLTCHIHNFSRLLTFLKCFWLLVSWQSFCLLFLKSYLISPGLNHSRFFLKTIILDQKSWTIIMNISLLNCLNISNVRVCLNFTSAFMKHRFEICCHLHEHMYGSKNTHITIFFDKNLIK